MRASFFARVARKLRRIDHALRPRALFERNCRFLLYHRPEALAAEPGVTAAAPAAGDEKLVRRIVAAYRRAGQADLGDSMWKMFFANHHEPIHRAFIGGPDEEAARILRDPSGTDLFYGFDILTKTHHGVFGSSAVRLAYARLCLDGLVRLAEAVGAVRLDNPETWAGETGERWEVEEVLSALAAAGLGFSAPNPYPKEHGVASSAGVISVRVAQALYQAWLIRKAVEGISAPRVLEIGAGLGRTAYHAHALGIADYTIVDIPITAAAQAYFLGTSLGADRVRLDGEPAGDAATGGGGVRIISPQTFLSEAATYDLVVNVDSLPEMDRAVAAAYWEKIKASACAFLSINHEANAFRVADLVAPDRSSIKVSRSAHWMRRGYAEEMFHLREGRSGAA